MSVKKIVSIFFITTIILLFIIFIYNENLKKKLDLKIIKSKEQTTKEQSKESDKTEEIIYNSNLIEDVSYTTKDAKGNEYLITAAQGEIDYSNPNILFLTKVKAVIKLKDSDLITIVSDYGKYNTNNFDTIFSKNVIIKYLENNIYGEYLDFSLERNTIIISRQVILENPDNILKADVLEMNIKTKDTKIFMHEKNKKVNIKNNN